MKCPWCGHSVNLKSCEIVLGEYICSKCGMSLGLLVGEVENDFPELEETSDSQRDES